MHYTIVDTHGYPTAVFNASSAIVQRNVSNGHAVVEGRPPNENVRWNGSEWEKLTQRPSGFHRWDSQSNSWIDSRPIEEINTETRHELNKQRHKRSSAFSFRGYVIQADPTSRACIASISSLVAMTGELPDDWSGFWLDASNKPVKIDSTEVWIEFVKALVTHDLTTHKETQAQKSALTQPK